MKRENLKNLGLEKEVVNQIMTWNGVDIEVEKRKKKEVERLINELKVKIAAKEEAENLKAAQLICAEMFKEAVKETNNKDKRIFFALL